MAVAGLGVARTAEEVRAIAERSRSDTRLNIRALMVQILHTLRLTSNLERTLPELLGSF